MCDLWSATVLNSGDSLFKNSLSVIVHKFLRLTYIHKLDNNNNDLPKLGGFKDVAELTNNASNIISTQ